MAAELRRNPDLEVELTNGDTGDFTILTDGREVISNPDELPSVEEAVAAVNDAALAK